jgi:hypothetical protein
MTSDGPITSVPKGYCGQCGKALTEQTLREVRGVFYCEDCLAGFILRPRPVESPSSPAVAALLGLIPGLGAVYNGEYFKALVHVMIFGSIIAMLERGIAEPFFVPLLILFILYMPIEAYQTAKAKLQGSTAPSLFGLEGSRLPVGPLLLIGLGVLLLLDNLELLNLERLDDFLWPLALIGVGIYLLYRRLDPESRSEAQTHEQRN